MNPSTIISSSTSPPISILDDLFVINNQNISLPQEIVFHILSFLSTESLINLSLTTRSWRYQVSQCPNFKAEKAAFQVLFFNFPYLINNWHTCMEDVLAAYASHSAPINAWELTEPYLQDPEDQEEMNRLFKERPDLYAKIKQEVDRQSYYIHFDYEINIETIEFEQKKKPETQHKSKVTQNNNQELKDNFEIIQKKEISSNKITIFKLKPLGMPIELVNRIWISRLSQNLNNIECIAKLNLALTSLDLPFTSFQVRGFFDKTHSSLGCPLRLNRIERISSDESQPILQAAIDVFNKLCKSSNEESDNTYYLSLRTHSFFS